MFITFFNKNLITYNTGKVGNQAMFIKKFFYYFIGYFRNSLIEIVVIVIFNFPINIVVYVIFKLLIQEQFFKHSDLRLTLTQKSFLSGFFLLL